MKSDSRATSMLLQCYFNATSMLLQCYFNATSILLINQSIGFDPIRVLFWVKFHCYHEGIVEDAR